MSGEISTGFVKDLIEILDGQRKRLSKDELERVEAARKRAAEADAEAKALPSVRDYEFAIFAQSACNLSGIVHEFSGVAHRLWNEAQAKNEGTDYVNRHPIGRLYAEQIAHLTGAGIPADGANDWHKAYRACEAVVEEAKRVTA